MKTIAVTGSDGFVGTHVCQILEKIGYSIIPIDLKNGIDLGDYHTLQNIPDFDIMVHLAAKVFVPSSYTNPANFLYSNFLFTLNALELTRKYKAKFILMSSYLYGNPRYLPIDELHPVNPHNPYATSKLISENLVDAYYKNYGLESVILRVFNLFGPGQTENFLIPKIFSMAKLGIVTLEDLKPRRDFLFIQDFMELLIRIIHSDITGVEIYNVGSGVSYSVEEVYERVDRLFKGCLKLETTNNIRINEIDNTVADITKISHTFDWTPCTTFEEGLSETYKAYGQ